MTDNNRSGCLFQAKNAIPINSWFDNQNDTALKDLIPVLETTLKNIKDVRYMLDANTKSLQWLVAQKDKPLQGFEPPA